MVVVGRGLDLQHDAEDEQVDEHQDDRVRERPREAEHRPLVLGAEVAAEEAAEELAVAEEVEVASSSGTSLRSGVPVPARTKLRTDRPLPFLPVNAIAAPFAALPVTALVLRALLQSPRASVPARATPAPSGGTSARLRRSGESASSPASPPASARHSYSAASPRPARSRRSSAAAPSSSSPASSTTSSHSPARRSSRLQFAAAAIVLSCGISVEIVARHARLGARIRLARRDHERVQPARQHGRARGTHRPRPSGCLAIAAATVNPNRDISSSRPPSRCACVAFLPFNLRPASPRPSSWATPAAR